MQRITIIGSGGSGKSTLAVRLGNLLSLPVYHLDALFWKPGWVETARPEWSSTQKALCNEPSWIMDGNYGGTIDIRLNASDTVIFLDTNRFVCLFRVLKRTLRHIGKTRPDMGSGCEERFELKFVQWILSYPTKKKPGILEKLTNLRSDVEVHVLKNQRDIDSFISRIEQR